MERVEDDDDDGERGGGRVRKKTTRRASREVVMCVSTAETDDLLDEGEDGARRTQRVGGVSGR